MFKLVRRLRQIRDLISALEEVRGEIEDRAQDLTAVDRDAWHRVANALTAVL